MLRLVLFMRNSLGCPHATLPYCIRWTYTNSMFPYFDAATFIYAFLLIVALVIMNHVIVPSSVLLLALLSTTS